MLALAVLPTLGKALAFWGAGDTRLAEVCTPQGMRLVPVPAEAVGDGSPVQPPAASHLEHCALCLLAAAPALPAGVQQPALPLLPAAHPLPAAEQPARLALQSWPRAQPRGPPTFS